MELYPFLIVLILSILAFTDAFFSLNKSYKDENQFESMKSYKDTVIYAILNTFGEFDTEGFDDIGMIFFILASVVNLIILLNLVIAIISETFNIVNAEKLQSFYMNRAQLLADVWTTFPPMHVDPFLHPVRRFDGRHPRDPPKRLHLVP